MKGTKTLMRVAGAVAVAALLAACGWGVGPVAVGLDGLSVSTGTLSPAFDPEVTEYAMTVPYSVESITVTVEMEDEDLEVSIDGESVVPGPGTKTISLSVGVNPIVVVVLHGIESLTYTVTVTREGPANMVVFGWLTYGDFNQGGDEVEVESGATIDFGTVGSGERELSFRITNEGSGPLRLQNGPDYVVISDDDFDSFSVPGQPAEETIPPGNELVFVLKFDGDGAGQTREAIASLTTNDPEAPAFTLSLTGFTGFASS